ncbi:DUF6612 family protein [Methanocaldococcus jannaschii]|nr:hypothetical protein [Methanocaldococcus jannaschii]
MRWAIFLVLLTITFSGCLNKEISKEEIIKKIDEINTFSYNAKVFINLSVSNPAINKVNMKMDIDGYSDGKLSKGIIHVYYTVRYFNGRNETIPFYVNEEGTFIKLEGKWQKITNNDLSNHTWNILAYIKDLIEKNDIKIEEENNHYIIRLKDENAEKQLNPFFYRGIKIPGINLKISEEEVVIILDKYGTPIKVIKKGKLYGTSSKGNLDGVIVIETEIKDINKDFDFSIPEDLSIYN